MKPIYLFSNKIKYRTFKKVMNRFPKGGIEPMHIDQIIWQAIRDKELLVYIDPQEVNDPVILATKLPKNKEIYYIK